MSISCRKSKTPKRTSSINLNWCPLWKISLSANHHFYPPVNKHSNGKSPSWIGNTSSNGGFSIAMLDYRSVSISVFFAEGKGGGSRHREGRWFWTFQICPSLGVGLPIIWLLGPMTDSHGRREWGIFTDPWNSHQNHPFMWVNCLEYMDHMGWVVIHSITFSLHYRWGETQHDPNKVKHVSSWIAKNQRGASINMKCWNSWCNTLIYTNIHSLIAPQQGWTVICEFPKVTKRFSKHAPGTIVNSNKYPEFRNLHCLLFHSKRP